MIKKELLERLLNILDLLGEDNCPTMNDKIIDVSKISIVNNATATAYDDLDTLIGEIKYD